MKIGKITFDGYNNYGNILQSYALQEYLKQFGIYVETIWHSPDERISEYWKWGLREYIKFIVNYKHFHRDIKYGTRAWELARRVRGMDFVHRYINVRYDVTDLCRIADDYDYFIVGSDQMWNPNNSCLSIAFLEFAPSNKRISYAVSIGTESIPVSLVDSYIKGINSMKSISVREDKAADIIYELTGKRVEVILDPVFNMNASRWRAISICPYWLNCENYAFLYFLDSIPQCVIDFVNAEGIQIVKCFDKESIDRYIASPEEWLYLISNAKYVFTDSFHATAFSIIFDRDFYVFPRIGTNEKQQMITRIESVLKTFNVMERLKKRDTEIRIIQNHPNYSVTIKKEIEKSDEYIKKALAF